MNRGIGGRGLILAVSASLLLTCAGVAQTSSQQRSFHASKAEVQKALHELPSYPGGKLPVLDGFADPGDQALESYKRGYYEYEVQIRPSGADTTVSVSAKVTAWYAGASLATSGYRLLKSSGRLESDLLDALGEKLNPKSASATAAARATPAMKSLPDTPSASNGSFFNTPRLTTAPSDSPLAKPAPAAPIDPRTARQLEALTQQAQSLEQVLHAQAHPNNLAVVKRSNTPVVAQPVDGAEVMLQADAEDEFEVLDSSDTWVHVKISALSRGWVRRDYVDLPGATTVSVASIADPQKHDLVRQTKEEVAPFPGQWQPLDGKQVKIIWVQPLDKDQFGAGPKWNLVKSIFEKADSGNPAEAAQIAGVVLILDAQDGGMTATTMANFQQWRAGHLSDETFWHRCWRDPADAFGVQN